MNIMLSEGRDIDINIKIGSEGYDHIPKDCLLVTATYTLQGKKLSTYGEIGPQRMNYQKVVAVLENVGKIIESILSIHSASTPQSNKNALTFAESAPPGAYSLSIARNSV